MACVLGAVTAVTTSQAQVPPITLPTVSVPTISVPTVQLPAPPAPAPPTPPQQESPAPPPPAPAPQPKIELPPVELPKVELPTVPGVPKVELPKVHLPKVELPKVQLPGTQPSSPDSGSQGGLQVLRTGVGGTLEKLLSAPRELLSGGRAPTGGGVVNQTGSERARNDVLAAILGTPVGGPAGSGAAGGSAALGGDVAGASLSGPAAQRALTRLLREASPRERRLIRRLAWDTALDGRALRRLRTEILDHQGCLGILSGAGRRALIMRAGLFGRAPATRRTIAQRLGVSPMGVLRLERSALNRLDSAAAAGDCDAGGGVALGLTIADAQGGSLFGGGGPAAPGRVEQVDRAAVLGATDHGGELDGSVGGSFGGDGDPGDEADPLLYFLAALLALLAGGILATRVIGGHGPLLPIPMSRPGSQRPLLFLDVDGVLALSPFAPALPPGRMHLLDFGAVYMSDRSAALTRELASRFDLVWATGWEHRANSELRSALGLESELPVLSFGKKARYGSSEWKIKEVDRYAGRRPAAWIDDNLEPVHEAWARKREAPTLLVSTASHSGISEEHVERLLAWADELATRGQAPTAKLERLS